MIVQREYSIIKTNVNISCVVKVCTFFGQVGGSILRKIYFFHINKYSLNIFYDDFTLNCQSKQQHIHYTHHVRQPNHMQVRIQVGPNTHMVHHNRFPLQDDEVA